jgi:ABC-type uncharacterized transport system substrate-binding protein
MMIGCRPIAVFAVLQAVVWSEPTAAHPHVFVDGKAEIVFDAQKRITAIRNVWQFDEAYSAFADTGLDTNGDGKLTQQELAPLAKLNMDSLKEYSYCWSSWRFRRRTWRCALSGLTRKPPHAW